MRLFGVTCGCSAWLSMARRDVCCPAPNRGVRPRPCGIRGASTVSHMDMQGGPVGELLDAAVERSSLDQLEVEVGRTLEDRV